MCSNVNEVLANKLLQFQKIWKGHSLFQFHHQRRRSCPQPYQKSSALTQTRAQRSPCHPAQCTRRWTSSRSCVNHPPQWVVCAYTLKVRLKSEAKLSNPDYRKFPRSEGCCCRRGWIQILLRVQTTSPVNLNIAVQFVVQVKVMKCPAFKLWVVV